MGMNSPKDGASGTTGQSPRWERPQENTPKGYLRAKANPDKVRDTNGGSNSDPEVKKVSDAFKTKDD